MQDFVQAADEFRVGAMATFAGRDFHSAMVRGKDDFCLQVILWKGWAEVLGRLQLYCYS